MKNMIKISTLTLLLFFSITSHAQNFGTDRLGLVDLSVSQQDLDFSTNGIISLLFEDGDEEGRAVGTFRNVATLELRDFSRLEDSLFGRLDDRGRGFRVFLRINDRSLVALRLEFEEGEEELIIGRARPMTLEEVAAGELLEEGVLRGRVRAIYDESADQLTIRYIERITTTETTFLDATRFDIGMGVRFGGEDIPGNDDTVVISRGSAPVVENIGALTEANSFFFTDR